jgi:hypothetical protein
MWNQSPSEKHGYTKITACMSQRGGVILWLKMFFVKETTVNLGILETNVIYVVIHKGKQTSNSEEIDCKTFVFRCVNFLR